MKTDFTIRQEEELANAKGLARVVMAECQSYPKCDEDTCWMCPLYALLACAEDKIVTTQSYLAVTR